MPVLVRTVSDAVARRWVEADAATTRRDPLAEARALHRRVGRGLSVTAAGREFGLSRTNASHRLRLLRLAPEVREQIARGELAPGLARVLVGLEESRQRAMAEHIHRERLTARHVEALVKAWKTGRTDPSPAVATLPPSPTRDPDQVRLEQAGGRPAEDSGYPPL